MKGIGACWEVLEPSKHLLCALADFHLSLTTGPHATATLSCEFVQVCLNHPLSLPRGCWWRESGRELPGAAGEGLRCVPKEGALTQLQLVRVGLRRTEGAPGEPAGLFDFSEL